MAADLRVLADPVRLRALRLLAREELAVGELAEALAESQPSVSRHLAALRDGGLVEDRRQGRFALFSLAPAARRPGSPAAAVLRRLEEEGDGDGQDDGSGDLARLADILRARRDRHLHDDGGGRAFVPGRSWAAWARALCWLVPPGLRVLDLGCGDGALTLEIARFAGEVLGVDGDRAVLRAARARARGRKIRNVRFEEGDMSALAHPDEAFDLVVLSQSLHHLADPGPALAEAVRVLCPGGRVLVLDLLPHTEQWVTERLGHRRLGFRPAALTQALADAGLDGAEVERMPGRARDPFRVLVATAVKPAGRRGGRRRS